MLKTVHETSEKLGMKSGVVEVQQVSSWVRSVVVVKISLLSASKTNNGSYKSHQINKRI